MIGAGPDYSGAVAGGAGAFHPWRPYPGGAMMACGLP
jgi:hypothetical protein